MINTSEKEKVKPHDTDRVQSRRREAGSISTNIGSLTKKDHYLKHERGYLSQECFQYTEQDRCGGCAKVAKKAM